MMETGLVHANDICEVIPIFSIKSRLAARLALAKATYDRTKMLFILDGVMVNIAVVLSSGVFLSGYLVYLGGSDFLIGLLNFSMNWAAIVGLFSFLIFERLTHRKGLLVTLLVISRVMVCSTIFLPLVFGRSQTTLAVLTAMIIIGNVIWGIYSVGFSVWLMNSVSRETRNDFIFRRAFWLRIAFSFVTVLMSVILDWTDKSYTGFLIVFLASMVFSLADAAIMSRVPEPANEVAAEPRFRSAAFFEPLRNREYRGLLLFILLFYSGLSISSSFTPLYLLRYLQFDYSFISIINVISFAFMIIFTRIWGKLESRLGLTKVFRLTGLFVICEFMLYGFLTNRTYFLLYFAPILSGIGNSGLNVFIVNYRYSLMPIRNRTIYEGWFNAIFGLSILIGPAVGSVVMNLLPVIENHVFQYSRFQLMYMISFLFAGSALLLAFRGRQHAAADQDPGPLSPGQV